jgi:MscS family membrane protein
LLTGLGVGGLAVALAIRPTLENLIGGLILFMDRPVRVGDFCTFGAYTGTVENIGARSTQVRALDRTVISVPNAAFADMQIINWAKCDMMQILTTIGLRYETEPDQLRYVLAKLREMFHAHPKIDRDTVRVRFAGYGASSLDIQIRVYALTREWNEFHAIREDVFLRVNRIVSQSGTGFAFPSQTLYLGRDGGLDEERSRSAVEEVGAWRRSGQLPFPVMADSRIERLAGTLDYPPHGSPGSEEVASTAAAAESLSAEEEPDPADDSEELSQPERK